MRRGVQRQSAWHDLPDTVECWDEERTRLAHLPFQAYPGAFDFAFQPSIDERLVRELANLAFVPEASNILLLGQPGVGKTHLAHSLGPQGPSRTASVPTSSAPTT